MKINDKSSVESQTKPKRVCMIAYTNYLSDGRVRLEAESLVNWGYEVFFLVPKGGATPSPSSLHGVNLVELGVRKYENKSQLRYIIAYGLFLAFAFLACTRLFIRSNVRVFHVHNMPDVLVFAALIPRLFGGKVILDVHDTIPETYLAKFGSSSRLLFNILRLEESISFAVAHKLICVNHIQRDALVKRGIPAEKITTIVTMPRFSPRDPAIKREQQQDQVFRMVNHGTISRRLGIDLIVQAAAKLVHEIPGFELHLFGCGDDLNNILGQIEALGLSNMVHYHGMIPWSAIPKELEKMDVGIIANRVNVATELMLPSKLIDYVVLGIPIIAPKLKTIQYYFSPDMISLFEPENIDSLVATTVELYRDKKRRQQQALNAKKFQDQYGWDNQGSGLKDFYRDLFNGNQPTSRP